MLRSIAVLAATLGVAIVLGGCGGGGTAASCSLYSHRLKMRVVFVFPGRAPVPPAQCSSLGRSLGPAAFRFRSVKGQSNYGADKRVCVAHRTGAEADVYADPHAAHFVERALCKFVKRVLALA